MMEGSVQGRSKWFNTLTSPILIIFGIEVPPGGKLRKPKFFGSRTCYGLFKILRFLGTAKLWMAITWDLQMIESWFWCQTSCFGTNFLKKIFKIFLRKFLPKHDVWYQNQPSIICRSQVMAIQKLAVPKMAPPRPKNGFFGPKKFFEKFF